MFTEDLTALFDINDFAVNARYDAKRDVPVIFDRDFLLQLGFVAGRQPAALVQTSALDVDPTGKSLVVNGTSYTIRGCEPIDDGAVAVLRLETQ